MSSTSSRQKLSLESILADIPPNKKTKTPQQCKFLLMLFLAH